MGKITDLKPQKRPGRVSVYIDGKYKFGLSDWQVADMALKIGQEVDEKALEKFIDSSEFGKLFDRTLAWLLLRKRSAWEVEDYLRRKTKDEDLRSRVYKQLEDRKYINDFEFAIAWINNRRLIKRVSSRRLRQELLAKRVQDKIIDEALSLDETDEIEVLKELIEKKRRISRYRDDEKLKQYLLRQGFNYDQIKEAMS